MGNRREHLSKEFASWFSAERLDRVGAVPRALVVAGLCVAALGLRLAMAPIDAGLQYVAFFPAVALSAVFFGARPALAATAFGVFAATFVLTPPYWGIGLEQIQRAFWPNLVFTADGFVISFAVESMHRYRRRSSGEAARVAAAHASLRTLMDALPFSAWLKDASGRYAAANEAFARSCGRSSIQEVVGRDDHDLFDADTARSRSYDDVESLSADSGRLIETREAAGASMRWTESFKAPVQDQDGALLGLVGFSRDVTGRRRAQEETEIAAATFEASSDALAVLDVDGRVLRANSAFHRLGEALGLSASGCSSCSPSCVWMQSTGNGFCPSCLLSGDGGSSEEVRRLASESGRWSSQVRVPAPEGGERILSVRVEPLAGVGVEAGIGVGMGMGSEVGVGAAPGSGRASFVLAATDETERRSAEEEVRSLAFFDPLTGLPNRRLLADRLAHAISSAKRGGDGALLFIDLDNFKTVNDTLGHEKGDELLRQTAKRLVSCLRAEDTAARLGGDEFVVMLEGLGDSSVKAAERAETVGAKILSALGEPYLVAGACVRATPSIGVALFDETVEGVDEVMKQADLAMYHAKSAGRNALRFFDPELQEAIGVKVELEAGLRTALAKGEFEIHLQPFFDRGLRIVGAEALLRWRRPEIGLVPPGCFIPVAEESGLIVGIGTWVLREVCLKLADWADDPVLSKLVLSANVSAKQIQAQDFLQGAEAILRETQAAPSRLKLELTESLLMSDKEGIAAKMRELRSHGVGFSLDDFGTGFSSLSYLKSLPFDEIKIDRSFVRDLLDDPNDEAIVMAVVGLSRGLGMKVVAEGVETQGQLDRLLQEDCGSFQGYLLAKPMPVLEFEAYVRAAGSREASAK